MVGNDVVDLLDPDTRPGAEHPRFDERVFSECERVQLRDSVEPTPLRWTFWAAKEAAYKVLRQLDRRPFQPALMRVDVDASGRGQVTCEDHELPVQILALPGAVHAVATNRADQAGSIVVGLGPLGRSSRDPSRAVRELAVRTVADRIGMNAEALEVRTEDRIPRLWLDGTSSLGLSLSHHGRLVAFACDLSDRAS